MRRTKKIRKKNLRKNPEGRSGNQIMSMNHLPNIPKPQPINKHVECDQTPPPRDESSDSEPPNAESSDSESEDEEVDVAPEVEVAPEVDVAPEATIGTSTQKPYAIRDFPRGLYEVGESSSARDSSYVGDCTLALRRDWYATPYTTRLMETEFGRTLGNVLERLIVLESGENATLKKKLDETETRLAWARMERDIAERSLHESQVWNKRFYLDMVRIGAVPKPPSDEEDTEPGGAVSAVVRSSGAGAGGDGAGGAGAGGAGAGGDGAGGAGAGGAGAGGARAGGAGADGAGIGTDISKITRKQSKTGMHGHENQKRTKRSQRIKAEARKYGKVKNHKKTIKNGQARTRESEEYKAEAKPKPNP
ncbi:hypothetical protein Tco_1252395 [Tanacetum coccineum]